MKLDKRRLISLGIVVGALIFTIKFCHDADKKMEEMDREMSSWTYETKDVEPVRISIMKDAPVPASIDIEAEDINLGCAPYDFLTLADEYQIYLEERCADMGLNFWLMASLMFSESSFKPGAYGDEKIGGSVGLFQINDVWWDYMAEKHGLDVFNPFDNIDAGLIIFKNLMDKYDDVVTCIQCYKCGESRGRRLLKEGKVLSSIEGIVDRALLWEEEGGNTAE